MKRLLSLLLVLVALFVGGCDFLGSDKGDGDGSDGGQEQGVVVDEK